MVQINNLHQILSGLFLSTYNACQRTNSPGPIQDEMSSFIGIFLRREREREIHCNQLSMPIVNPFDGGSRMQWMMAD